MSAFVTFSWGRLIFRHPLCFVSSCLVIASSHKSVTGSGGNGSCRRAGVISVIDNDVNHVLTREPLRS